VNMPTLRQRRVTHEWEALQQLQAESPDKLLTLEQGGDEAFLITVAKMPALICQPSEHENDAICDQHSLKIVFPRYYPSMPCEVFLSRSVFHPNVDPVNGFVCLWNQYLAAYTSLHALAQLAAVLSWRLVNPNAVHLMQPDALDWYKSESRIAKLPLADGPWLRVEKPYTDGQSPRRRRLS